MPGTRCTVAVCCNSYSRTKRAGMNIIYHKFPNKQPYRDIWIKACRRGGKWNPSSCHICSIHFTENDYKQVPHFIRNICCTKRRLKPTAVPSLFLTEPPPIELETLTPRKKLKILEHEDEGTMPETIIYVNETDNTHQSVDLMPNIEIYLPDNTTDLEYNYKEEDKDALSEAYCDSLIVEDNETIEERYSLLNDNNYITVRDCSTQTDTDYFLENYRLLVDKTDNLENDLVKWNNKYKKLMIYVKCLEAKVQNSTVNSGECHSAAKMKKEK